MHKYTPQELFEPFKIPLDNAPYLIREIHSSSWILSFDGGVLTISFRIHGMRIVTDANFEEVGRDSLSLWRNCEIQPEAWLQLEGNLRVAEIQQDDERDRARKEDFIQRVQTTMELHKS